MKKNSIFARIKSIVLYFLSPIPITKKSHFVLNVLWIALAVICLIAGVIVGLTTDFILPDNPELFFLNFWITFMMFCAIPFVLKLIKYLYYAIRGGLSMGKAIEYTNTYVREVSPLSGVYEITKEKKNASLIVGFLGLIVFYMLWAYVFLVVGIVALIARIIWTVKYLKEFNDGKSENV